MMKGKVRCVGSNSLVGLAGVREDFTPTASPPPPLYPPPPPPPPLPPPPHPPASDKAVLALTVSNVKRDYDES